MPNILGRHFGLCPTLGRHFGVCPTFWADTSDYAQHSGQTLPSKSLQGATASSAEIDWTSQMHKLCWKELMLHMISSTKYASQFRQCVMSLYLWIGAVAGFGETKIHVAFELKWESALANKCCILMHDRAMRFFFFFPESTMIRASYPWHARTVCLSAVTTWNCLPAIWGTAVL